MTPFSGIIPRRLLARTLTQYAIFKRTFCMQRSQRSILRNLEGCSKLQCPDILEHCPKFKGLEMDFIRNDVTKVKWPR